MSLTDNPEVMELIARAVKVERESMARLARDEAAHNQAIADRLRQQTIITTNMVSTYERCAHTAERLARAIEASGDFTTSRYKFRILKTTEPIYGADRQAITTGVELRVTFKHLERTAYIDIWLANEIYENDELRDRLRREPHRTLEGGQSDLPVCRLREASMKLTMKPVAYLLTIGGSIEEISGVVVTQEDYLEFQRSDYHHGGDVDEFELVRWMVARERPGTLYRSLSEARQAQATANSR